MNFIYNISNLIKNDKKLHFLMCFFLSSFFYHFLIIFLSKNISIFLSLLIVTIIGLLKEYYDKKSKKYASEFMDIVFNTFGIIAFIIIINLNYFFSLLFGF